MKKHFLRGIAVLCAAVVCAGLFLPAGGLEVSASEYYFVGQDSNTTTALKVGGTDTGADYTRVHLTAGSAGYATGSSYGRYINIVEADLSNTKLSFEVINHVSSVDGGNYIRGSCYLTEVVKNYSEDDKTILAAVNGDWMHWVDSAEMGNIPVTTNYRVTTGVTIIDKEIWCSELTAKETAYDGPYSFGITSSNQPVIGMLKAKVTLKNTTNGKSITTDGLNRAPANNSLVVYNERLSDGNRVPSDAYEILIKTDGTNKFTHNTEVTGTVEAIYASGTTSRHALQAGYLVITARGNRISELQNNFAVGNKVSVTASLYDTWSKNNDLWAECEEAIGGHMMVLKDGNVFDANLLTNTSNYPTSVIGFKDDGTVMLSMVTADSNGHYVGLKFSQMAAFCKDVGYNTCFLLDGGGSTTMVTINAGSYVERACYSDGAQRKVWNSIALVYDPTPTVSKQGSLSHISVPERFDPFNVKFTSNLKSSFTGANASSASVSDGILTLKTTSKSNDAYIYFDFTSASSKVNASDYKYIVLRYKTNSNALSNTFKMYLCAGSTSVPTENSTASFAMTKDNAWHTKVVDLSKVSAWSGNLINIRLDFFEGNSNSGDSVQISNWGFAKTASEADALAKAFGEDASSSTPTPTPTAKPSATPTGTPTSAPTGTVGNETAAPDETTAPDTGDSTPDVNETTFPDGSSAPGTETDGPATNPAQTDDNETLPPNTDSAEENGEETAVPTENSGTEEKPDNDKKTGCFGTLGMGSVLSVIAAAIIFIRKKDN